MGVDHKAHAVLLDDVKGGTVAWKPGEIGGRRGGSVVYRAEGIKLHAGNRIRWTRNDAGLGLVNSRTAEVLSVANGRVTFQLEDGKKLELGRGGPQLRRLDHAWASTVHAFQGRTVDNVIAAMEVRRPATSVCPTPRGGIAGAAFGGVATGRAVSGNERAESEGAGHLAPAAINAIVGRNPTLSQELAHATAAGRSR